VFFYGFDEVEGSHQIGVICQGHRRHLITSRSFDQVIDSGSRLQNGILGMGMQVNKGGVLQNFLFRIGKCF
jgi:hypothetical protein